jgi:hypothetical protein
MSITSAGSGDERAETLPPSVGFVRVRHPATNAVADIPAVALSLHRSRGWVLDDDDDEREPITTTEAAASDNEEDEP